jgi:hypothetical protein
MSTIRERNAATNMSLTTRADWDRRDLLAALDRLVQAAELPRNTLISTTTDHNEKRLKDEWVAVPRNDFTALRTAIEEARKVTG